MCLSNIKTSANHFKQSLLTLNPWTDKIEHQRHSLRNQYLALLNNQDNSQTTPSPYAREALNLIWLDTSHAIINIYRQKISAIDTQINQSNPAHLKKPSRKNTRNSSDRNPPPLGFVARRKLVQHFRSFLRAEDAFWKSLINRLINDYHIEDARGCLKTLNLLIINDFPPNHGDQPVDPTETKNKDPNNNNNSSKPQVTLVQGILLLHKALICFGDLIRYTELYSRSGKQGTTNHHESRHQQKSNPVLERDWSRSYDFYNQARLLIPTDGNPSNQLAVLSSYIPDLLSSAYHYYRALCVKNPFPTARQNLGMTYSKTLAKPTLLPDLSDSHFGPNNPLLKTTDSELLVSQFKSHFVELHARLYSRTFTSFSHLSVNLCCEFTNHLKERLLPPELILKVIVTCMAAAWHARVGWRNVHHHSESERFPTTHSYTTELNTTIHFLQFAAALFSIAKEELESIGDLTHDDIPGQVDDLSQNISAILRRILPAMRIISKWVLSGHFDHINRIKQRLEKAKNIKFKSQLCKAEAEFWVQYDVSVELIKKHFPIHQLPTLSESIQLEEDLELMGFSPIDRAIRRVNNSTRLFFSIASESCHPNEEHLMRLGDLQADSELIEAKYKVMKTQLKSILMTSMIQNKASSGSSSNGTEESDENPDDDEDDVHLEGLPNDQEHWIDDEDPVELAMRVVVAQQMDNQAHPSDITPIEFLPFDSFDHPEQQGEEAENNITNTRTDQESTGFFNTAIDPKDTLIGGVRMSTAADLLASIISGPSHMISAPDPFVTAPSTSTSTSTIAGIGTGSGWNSFERVRSKSHVPTSTIFSQNKTKTSRVYTRTPSISLPKPPDFPGHVNIWSNVLLHRDHLVDSLSPTNDGASGSRVKKDDWPAPTAFFG